MLIPNITQRLRELTTLLCTTDAIGAEQAYIIASFFRDFGETNAVISEAIQMAETDADQLQTNVGSLLSAIADYEDTDRTKLLQADFKAIVDAHINTFEEPQKAAQQRATDLRHVHRELSNRLDWIADMDSEEYKQLDAECDKAKAAYDEASAENIALYNRCRAEKMKYAFVYYTEPEFIDILIAKLRRICESILADLKNGKEAADE